MFFTGNGEGVVEILIIKYLLGGVTSDWCKNT